jgi:hypothetical protein
MLSYTKNIILCKLWSYRIPNTYCLEIQRTRKIKKPGLIEKGLAQPHYSIQHIEGYDLLFYKDIRQVTSSGTDKKRKDYQEYHDMACS